MQVTGGNGVQVTSGSSTIYLDPKRVTENAVVTHGHTDHLVPNAHMTPPTLDFLRVRKPTRAGSGKALPYHQDQEVDGLTVRLHDAGHVLGSAMVQVTTPEGDLVYTGDFNPKPSFTCEAAKPLPCHTLVMESTYGDPRFDLPPRELVLESLEAWMLHRIPKGPVAFGAYPLGRAQELIFLANRAGITPIVSPDVASITAVYNSHGHDLAYAVAGSERARNIAPSGALHIVPREWLKRGHDFARGLKADNGVAAYLSGWCHRYTYFSAYDIDAQFALSDHAAFRDLIGFVAETKPRRVYTMHGASGKLATEIRKRLDIKAEPL